MILSWMADRYFFHPKQSAHYIDGSSAEISIGNVDLTVEVVNQVQSLAMGLSSRDEIGSDGMLFFLPEKKLAAFWMKDMKFNLDIIWIDGDRVVDISYDLPMPEPDTTNAELPFYSPKIPVDRALEVVAGDVEKFGIEVGDRVRYH